MNDSMWIIIGIESSMELTIHYILAVLYFVFGLSGFLYYIILKGVIFYRLKRNTNHIWVDLGSPKFFALYENADISEHINNSSVLLAEIQRNDPLNIKFIKFAVLMKIVAAWLLPFVLLGAVVLYLTKWF